MEQPIWLFFGVIAVIVTFGVIIKVIGLHEQETRKDMIVDSLNKMETMCDFVCGTTKDNKMSVDVKLPSDIWMYTNQNKICIELEKKVNCRTCDCDLLFYELSLDTELSKKANEHEYTCYFEKTDVDVGLECLA